MKNFIYLILLLFIPVVTWNQVLINTNLLPGAVGEEIQVDEFGHVSRVSAGTIPGDIYSTIDWSNYRSSFVELNGGSPIEIINGTANMNLYNGVPAAPQGAANGFFFPDRFDHSDWTYTPGVREEVWHTIIDYNDGAGIHLIGGTGFLLTDPSPTLGFPYTEFRPANQFTNVGDSMVTLRSFVYTSISVLLGTTSYTNHDGFFFDYDGIDGTSDDITISSSGGALYMFNFSGFPLAGYNIGSSNNNMLGTLQGAAPGYSLPNSTNISANPAEVAFQYPDVTLEPGQTILYWLDPKPIKLWNNANNFTSQFDYDIKNVGGMGNIVFANTDVEIFVSSINFVTNAINNVTADSTKITVAEITGGMIESELAPTVSAVLNHRYWEIFYDTRHLNSLNNITFSYDEIADGIEDESRLTLVYRTDYDQQWTEWISTLDMANNKITAETFPGGNVQFALALKNIIQIDGNFDGEDIWGTPVALSDQTPGWTDVNIGDLYVTHDENYLYLGAKLLNAADWQSWGFLINTRDGGGDSDPWTHPIQFAHANLPDFVVRGHFGMGGSTYAELREWDGANWININTKSLSSFDYYSEEDHEIVEVRLPLDILGNPATVDVQFFITGDNTGEHGTFDAVPNDDVVASWNVSGNPSILDNFSQDIVVPVELMSFTASVTNNGVILNWKTATETNNLGFEIYRNTGNEWDKIGFVSGAGNSTEFNDYSFTDNSTLSGTVLYRLKQIDYDGSFEYSDIVEVTREIVNKFYLSQNYPNPFNPSTVIKYAVPAELSSSYVRLEVYDILGNLVSTLVNGKQSAGEYEVNFNGDNLSSGVYIYKLSIGNNIAVKRMTLLK